MLSVASNCYAVPGKSWIIRNFHFPCPSVFPLQTFLRCLVKQTVYLRLVAVMRLTSHMFLHYVLWTQLLESLIILISYIEFTSNCHIYTASHSGQEYGWSRSSSEKISQSALISWKFLGPSLRSTCLLNSFNLSEINGLLI